jgi:Kef-type K+ transport system membrane component KefB
LHGLPLMNRFKNLLFYVLTIAVFSVLIYLVILKGRDQEAGRMIATSPASSNWQQFKDTYFHNITHPLAMLLVQIITIIVFARLFGYACRKIKQPTVIGEIIAGIFLGPSFLGLFFPEFSAFLFPKTSLSNLQFLSQIGLILFMFVVGMELDMKMLKNKAQDAVVISHASIIFPFALGIGLAYYLYEGHAPPTINFLSFSLFIGISMSITAFPVLARIVQERGLSKTRLGTIVITCAAADDITAWCMLAAVIAIVKAGSIVSSVYTIVIALLYVFIMLRVVSPFLKNFGDKYSNKEGLSKPVVAIFFIILLISAYTSEVIGIHALFGAFLAGVIMPANIKFRNIFIEKVEDVSLVLLLPLFFVFTGLRTQIGLLNEPGLWVTCILIISVAVAGKFLGSAFAAKFVGQTWKDSLTIGALMNTRGLMELVVLNIGYDLGVLNPAIFAMMVIMALVTTFMTAPALSLINRIFFEKFPSVLPKKIGKVDKYSILVSFGSPQKGVALVRMANALIGRSDDQCELTAMHLSPSNEINQYNFAEFENESFRPVKAEAKRLGLKVNLFFKPSQDIEGEIIETANKGNFDLLLIGVGRSVFSGTLLGRTVGLMNRILNPFVLFNAARGKEKLIEGGLLDEKVRSIIKNTHVPIGILIEKKLEKIQNIFVPVFSGEDITLLEYSKKLIKNSDAHVVVMDATGNATGHSSFKEALISAEQTFPQHFGVMNDKKVDKVFVNEQDLILVSADGLRHVADEKPEWLSLKASVLIVKA